MKNTLLAATLCCASLSINAQVIKGDWAVAGDNATLADLVTGVEWLTLTKTKGMSISEVSSQLDTTFNGWRLPSRAEVNLFMTHIAPGVTTIGQANAMVTISTNTGNNIANMLGLSGTNGTRNYAYGMYSNDAKLDGETDVLFSGVFLDTAYARVYDGFSNGLGINDNSPYYSVFLVSDGGTTLHSLENPEINANNANNRVNDVPVPASLGLLGLAMAGFGFRRKEK